MRSKIKFVVLVAVLELLGGALFSSGEMEDLNSAYRRRGFTQKDRDYFQMNWYADTRMGYSDLHERKELDEEIARETFGPNR